MGGSITCGKGGQFTADSPFDVLDRLSGTYEKKGLPLDEAVPLYGIVDNYRTNFDDFREVYLFGSQVDR